MAWRLEQAFDAAWPAMDGVRVGDWLCKIGGGVSRRSNSANPSGPAARLREPLLLAVAEVYDAVGQPAYVRVPSMLDLSADRLLQAHGWVFEGESLTLVAPLPDGADAEIALAARPSADWLAAMNAINGRSLQAAAAFEAILGRLAAPAAFASVRREGAIVSGAYGALYDGWLCIEAVATGSAWRGRGLARDAVSALMAWGAGRGGEGACLQVSADNAAGQALYRRLGFGRELYRYHYRRKTQTRS